MMAEVLAWLVGIVLVGTGVWILLLRFEGLVDLVYPRAISIAGVTVDGKDSQTYAELMRARFDHHFRRPEALPRETGFLEVVGLDAPELFQPKSLGRALDELSVEVSGVNVSKLVKTVNDIARPDQWVVEGDLQTRSDRVLLALRMRRGSRLIRTWYLEELGDPSKEGSALLEKLIDDAIFQIVYDFGNEAEQSPDLRKWREVVNPPVKFPSRTAVAAYYEARGALGRYYAHGRWGDLDLALDRLRTLRSEMPDFPRGLQLLGIALAEKRQDRQAILVFEQLLTLLSPEVNEEERATQWKTLDFEQKHRILAIRLLKATAMLKLYSWQSTHEAVRELTELDKELEAERAASAPRDQKTAYLGLEAQTAVQLAHAYALYIAYLRHSQVAEVFKSKEAPAELRIEDAKVLATLSTGSPTLAKPIVLDTVRKLTSRHLYWREKARHRQNELQPAWSKQEDGNRRATELASRIYFTEGHAQYRMSEWEDREASAEASIFGETWATRIERAAEALRRADAAHPNHYLVLQLLGRVYADLHQESSSSHVAEQYLERAIAANPSDYNAHAALARVLMRSLSTRGLDQESRPLLERAFREAQTAVELRDFSGAAHLLRAKIQTMRLEVENDAAKREGLRSDLSHYLAESSRFLPMLFGRPDPDLTWLRILDETRQLGVAAEAAGAASGDPAVKQRARDAAFAAAQAQLLTDIDALRVDCVRLRDRWVARGRVAQIVDLNGRADALATSVRAATLDDWRQIPVTVR